MWSTVNVTDNSDPANTLRYIDVVFMFEGHVVLIE